MGENSNIEWTTHTFNPWRGCTKVSPGCKNCYAERLSNRNPGTLGQWGPNGTRVVASEATWKHPVRWNQLARTLNRRPRVFCASLADVFEDWQGPMLNAKGERLTKSHVQECLWSGNEPVGLDYFRHRLFCLIDRTRRLDWLLLTKRPENICGHIAKATGRTAAAWLADCKHAWLGTSVEDQPRADERIPHLIQCPAKVRFLSCEPLLGPLDLSPWLRCGECRGRAWDRIDYYEIPCPACGGEFAPGIQWIIVGGESGPHSRPCNVAWIRNIVQQCKAAGVACFVKQLGSVCLMSRAEWDKIPYVRDKWVGGRAMLLDKKGGDPAEWPEDLRVREFPRIDGREHSEVPT